MTRPHINVTPLIDVLLVLLIIFMVVAPLKPSSFKTKIPVENRNGVTAPGEILVVVVGQDSSLTLNTEHRLGTAADAQPLVARLKSIFEQRIANGEVAAQQLDDPKRPFDDNIERTVFIRAPKHLDYGSVARVVDAVKLGGGYPIGLQIDGLE